MKTHGGPKNNIIGMKKQPICYKCGEKGHYKSYCKNSDVKVCYVCQDKTHLAKSCSNKVKTSLASTSKSIISVMDTKKKKEKLTVQKVEVVKSEETENKKTLMKNFYRKVYSSSMCIVKESVVESAIVPDQT